MYVLSVDDGIISAITNEYIDQGIREAHRNHAAAVVIQLDTPGGMLSSTHQIVKTIMNAPVPVIVYVYPAGARAGSAGVFITLAGHIAAMHPASHIGAAHPVDAAGNWTPEEEESPVPGAEKKAQPNPGAVMSRKILNDTVSAMRVIAKSRGRNEEWAVKAVTESASITAEEALRQHVIDLVASDTQEVLNRVDGMAVTVAGKPQTLATRNAPQVAYRFTVRQQILAVLTHPMLAYALLMIGLYGILFEVTHPGVGVSGFIGVVCLVLALTAMQALSFNMAGLGLIALGLGMFVVEVFVPSMGFLSIGGVICLVTGALLLYQTGEPYLMGLIPYIAVTALLLGLLTAFVINKVVKTYRNRPVTDPAQKLVGKVGRTMTPIEAGGRGKIRVYGEIWDATATQDLAAGDEVRVLGFEPGESRLLAVAPHSDTE